MISFVRVLVLLSALSTIVNGQAAVNTQQGSLNKDIYTFLKSNQLTSKVRLDLY